MAEIVNTFVKGMDKDTDKAYLSNESYLDAHNFRITTTKGSSTGSLETVLGNNWLRNPYAQTDNLFGTDSQKIIGGVELDKKLILFTTNIQSDAPSMSEYLSSPGTYRSAIYEVTVNVGLETIERVRLLYDDTLNHEVGEDPDPLYFSTKNPIKAVVRYETERIKRIYWTDGYNNIRTCNVGSGLTPSTSLTTDGQVISYPTNRFISTDKLAFLSEFNVTRPEVSAVTSGKVMTGVVFYAYQLYQSYGKETVVSPMSSAITVVSSSDTLANTKEYYGNATSVPSGKGFKVHITGLKNAYDRLRLIRVHYATKDAIPTITIAAEEDISITADNVYMVDTGETMGELTLDEFNINTTGLFTCEDIAIKDNILFAGNITERLFDMDLDYDCRAARFNSEGIAHVYQANSMTPTIFDDLGVTWFSQYSPDHDGINLYNNVNYDGNAAYEFKYQKTDNTKWGAEGTNITIGFKVEEMVIDDTGLIYTTATDSAMENEVGSYSSFANPVTAGRPCWQRDETYRLYLVGFNDRGQRSFPRWICDLRMPSYFDEIIDDDGNTVEVGKLVHTGEDGIVKAYLLYPTITIKNLPAGTVSAQVYRMERGSGDRSIITQGVSLPMTYNTESDTNTWGPAACKLDNYAQPGTLRWYVKPDNDATIPGPLSGPHTNLSLLGDGRVYQEMVVDPVRLYRIVSPELMYMNSLELATSNAYLELVTDYHAFPTQHLRGNVYDNTTTSSEQRNTGFYYYKGFNNTIYTGGYTPAWLAEIRRNVSAVEKVSFFDTSKKQLGGYTYRNYTGDIAWTGLFNNTDMRYGSYGSTCLLATTSASASPLYSPSYNTLPIVNYKAKIFDSQYGGNTYNSRIGNISIPCSDVIKDLNASTVIAGGDTYINYFEVMPDMFDLSTMQFAENGGYATWSSLLHIPIESSINLELNHSRSQLRRRLTSETGAFDSSHTKMTQEVAGDYWMWYDKDVKYSYNQSDNLYLYNPVYSQAPLAQALICKHPWKLLENEFRTRIIASHKKVNGELSDSWTKFGVNDFTEVNGEYGDIWALTTFDDKLFYFQERAFGIASVNAQSLIQDNNSAQLVLGTGGVLARTDYASTHAGCMDKFSIVSSKAGLYWVDRLQRIIFRFGEGLVPLSKVNNIQSYLDNTTTLVSIDNPNDSYAQSYHQSAIRVCLDREFNEVLFTFRRIDSWDDAAETIVFSEETDSFVSFYDIHPSIYIPFANKYITTAIVFSGEYTTYPYNRLFIHNSRLVPRGSFYAILPGENIKDSTLKILFNPEYGNTKAFDNLYYVSNAYDTTSNGEVEQFQNTFDVIRLYDNYQITDYVELVPKEDTAPGIYTLNMPIERRERGWTLAIPRSVMAYDVQTNADIFDSNNYNYYQPFKERLRDKYLVVDLIYYNSKNTNSTLRFNVNHIGLKYRTSIR